VLLAGVPPEAGRTGAVELAVGELGASELERGGLAAAGLVIAELAVEAPCRTPTVRGRAKPPAGLAVPIRATRSHVRLACL